MRKSVAPFAHTLVAALMAVILAFSMVPLAWADDGPAGTIAGTVAGNAADTEGSKDAAASNEQEAPEASAQSASTKAAEGSGTGGTTVSIAVYRSSFPIAKWDLNDDDFNLTKAVWESRPADPALPQQASPGSEVAWPESGKPADYKEPTRAGFEFAGWSTNKSASAGGYIDGNEPKLTMPKDAPKDKEYTLYALWTPNEYAVIFDLGKNPDPSRGPLTEDAYALNWSTQDGIRTVSKIDNSRYRVSGFTMKEADYDKTTRTVGLPVPARSGYRFLGWTEPSGQNLAVDNANKDGYAMNPVRLTQIDGTPVLVARWAAAFGVTAPISITFGDYDKTGAPGNPWLGDAATEAKAGEAADDATQSEADDTAKGDQEGYEALGQAYFENTGWDLNVSIVKVESARAPSANQVLTTFDSSKASEAQVLGGTDGEGAEHEGERLLSMYPLAAVPEGAAERKEKGVHFRLDDTVAEGAGSNLGAFVIAGKTYESEDHKLPVSFGLNLSTDPVDGSANHGLVLPTNDYERKQIATVSYTFAQTAMNWDNPIQGDGFFIDLGNQFLGLENIKSIAEQLSRYGSASPWYEEFYKILESQRMVEGHPGGGPYFKLRVDGRYLDVQLIGICQDVKTGGGGEKAGLSFALRDMYACNQSCSAEAGGGFFDCAMGEPTNNSGGWLESGLRDRLRQGFMQSLDPAVQSAIVPVDKMQQLSRLDGSGVQITENETVWLPSMYEVFGREIPSFNPTEALTDRSDLTFQYQAFAAGHTSEYAPLGIKTYNGNPERWFLRSAYQGGDRQFCAVLPNGFRATGEVGNGHGVVPCFAM